LLGNYKGLLGKAQVHFHNAGVGGSSPPITTIYFNDLHELLVFKKISGLHWDYTFNKFRVKSSVCRYRLCSGYLLT